MIFPVITLCQELFLLSNKGSLVDQNNSKLINRRYLLQWHFESWQNSYLEKWYMYGADPRIYSRINSRVWCAKALYTTAPESTEGFSKLENSISCYLAPLHPLYPLHYSPTCTTAVPTPPRLACPSTPSLALSPQVSLLASLLPPLLWFFPLCILSTFFSLSSTSTSRASLLSVVLLFFCVSFLFLIPPCATPSCLPSPFAPLFFLVFVSKPQRFAVSKILKISFLCS